MVTEPLVAVPVLVAVWTNAAATPPDKSTSVTWKNETQHCTWVLAPNETVVAPVVEPEALAANKLKPWALPQLSVLPIWTQVKPLPDMVGVSGPPPRRE